MLGLKLDRQWALKLLFVIVFLLSAILHLSLALVNRQAFDDHVGVINLILKTDRLPETPDCEECFQPKLFYSIAVVAMQVAHVNIAHQNSVIIATQLINFVAGEIVLLLIYLFMRQKQLANQWTGLIAFVLLAFNPALTAANGMASNDTFAILFSSIAIYLCWRFFQNEKIAYLIVSGFFVAMGAATKTNIWGTALAIFGALLIWGVKEKRLRGIMIAVVFLLGVFLATILNPLSQYWDNFQRYGTPVTLNVKKEAFPSFFEKTYVRRPGIVSIQDGLFTFKFIDLLEYPRLTLGATGYPAHRTSLWTDVFASANSMHFYNSPDSWHTKPDFGLTRGIFVLALVPTALLCFGVILGWIQLVQGLFSSSNDLIAKRSYGLFDVVLIGYLAFLAALALQYRDFSTMKAIYIYPALLSFVVLFADGIAVFNDIIVKKRVWIDILFGAVTGLLTTMYITDAYQMIVHLYSLNIK
jgi:hypothetical protein